MSTLLTNSYDWTPGVVYLTLRSEGGRGTEAWKPMEGRSELLGMRHSVM